MKKKFLGRMLDTNTMTYSYSDESGGKLPIEMKYETLQVAASCRPDGVQLGNGIAALAVIWAWKKRLGIDE